ncbi:MAG: glycosyltransferase family 39 protein [Candidatus Aureabacteria bacterium]|nr:glycosyltransferase family 39 protein [Candidatus Auribacterota bacterium]
MPTLFDQHKKTAVKVSLLASLSIFILYYYNDIFFNTFIQSVIGFVINTLLLILVIISILGIGFPFVFRIKKDIIHFSIISSFLFGSIIVSQSLFFLGLFKILIFPLILIIFTIGILSFFYHLHRRKQILLNAFKDFNASFSKLNGISIFLIFLILTTIIITFIASSYPPYFSDEIGYHLLNPKRFIEQKSIAIDIENPYTVFPISIELLYTYIMFLFGDQIPKLFHCFLNILSVILIYKIARKEFSQKAAITSACIFSITPVIAFYSSTAFITSGIIVFFLASFNFLFDYLQKGETKDLLSLSACVFFLLTSHHSTIMFVLSYILCIILLSKRAKQKVLPSAKKLILIIFLFVLIALPFYLRNFILTGDPVYPVLASALKIDNWNSLVDYTITKQFYFSKGYGRSIKDLLLLPFHLTFDYKSFSTLDHAVGFGPLFLILLPLLIVEYRKKRSLLFTLSVIIIPFCTLFWFIFMPHFGRFLFPVIALLSIPLGVILTNSLFPDGVQYFKKILLFSIIISMAINIITIIQCLHPSYLFLKITGQFEKESFLKDVSGYGYISARLLDQSKKIGNIAYLKEFSPYHSKFKSYSFYTSPSLSKVFMTPLRLTAISKKGFKGKKLYNCSAYSKKEIELIIKKMNIRFLVLSKEEYNKMKNDNLDNIIINSKPLFKTKNCFVYEIP